MIWKSNEDTFSDTGSIMVLNKITRSLFYKHVVQRNVLGEISNMSLELLYGTYGVLFCSEGLFL